eukprot:bmy_08220T0
MLINLGFQNTNENSHPPTLKCMSSSLKSKFHFEHILSFFFFFS